MFRIDNSTSVATLPITPVAGTGRYFTNGNPVSGIPATVVDDWWTNMIQEEIITVVINAGLTPSKVDRTQLWQAIQSMISGSAGGPDYDPFLPLAGGTLYAPASSDLLALQTDPGYACRVRYTVAGARTWMAGVDTGGNFTIVDQSADAQRFLIEPGGRTICQAGLAVYGAIAANSLSISGGGISADGPIWSGDSVSTAGGVTGQYVRATGNLFADHNLYFNSGGTVALWDQGNGYLYCNAGFSCASQVLTNSLGVTNNGSISGNLAMGGQVSFGGGANSLQWQTNGYLTDYGNFQVTGHLITSQSLTVGTSIYCNNSAGGGGIYCIGATVDGYGLVTRGNIRFIGSGAVIGGSTWITWESISDSRPYAVAVANDRWGVCEAAFSAGQITLVNRLFGVFVGGVQVENAGNAYKAGGGMWADSSERRFKDAIEDYSAGLDVVTRLRPRSYTLNGTGPGHIFGERRHVGLIADEAADIMPEIMGEWPLGHESIATIDATAIVYALVNSVRELSDRVQNLEGRT